jgi:hypothetical protein
MIAFLHDTVFSHTVEICGHAEFHLKLGCVRHKVRAGGPSAYLQMSRPAAGEVEGISGRD